MADRLKSNPLSQLKAENESLRRRVRELQKKKKSLQAERDKYLQALLARFKNESQQDDWNDFDPEDYRYTLEDIFAQFEREEKICLPRRPRSGSSTPAKSRKNFGT